MDKNEALLQIVEQLKRIGDQLEYININGFTVNTGAEQGEN